MLLILFNSLWSRYAQRSIPFYIKIFTLAHEHGILINPRSRIFKIEIASASLVEFLSRPDVHFQRKQGFCCTLGSFYILIEMKTVGLFQGA